MDYDDEGESAANGCVVLQIRSEIGKAAVAVKFHPLRKLFVAKIVVLNIGKRVQLTAFFFKPNIGSDSGNQVQPHNPCYTKK